MEKLFCPRFECRDLRGDSPVKARSAISFFVLEKQKTRRKVFDGFMNWWRYCYQKASCEPCRTPSSEISAVDVPTKLPTIFGLAPLGGRFLSCPIRAYARARVLGSKLTVTGRSHANRGAMTLVSSGHCYCPLLLLWLDGASGAGTQNHSALITLALR